MDGAYQSRIAGMPAMTAITGTVRPMAIAAAGGTARRASPSPSP